MSTSPPDGTSSFEPYIPASQSLPEITVKAVILGIILSVVLAAANAYLGLKAGLTVSASIPAAVVSMAVLRAFRTSNILENNIVQTAASAGESLVAGVIFTLPALLMLGAWTKFNYWETTLIAAMGGLLGVMFTIPLRRALIVERPLTFPEGVATAEVLKVGDQGGGISSLLVGALFGGLFKLGASGFKLFGGAAHAARSVGGSAISIGSELGPALLGVGYIVGLNIGVLVFLGGAINWLLIIPIFSGTHDWPVYGAAAPEAFSWLVFEADETHAAGSAVAAGDYADLIWGKHTRFVGVGAMLVGGVWALLRLWKSIGVGVRSGFEAYRAGRDGEAGDVPRTERDTPMHWVVFGAVISAFPLFGLYTYLLSNGIGGSDGLELGAAVALAAFMSVIMIVAGFLFSAVASYMAGLVGSSNNPISGVTIATVLTSSLLLLYFLGGGHALGPMAAIAIGGVVCCAAAIGGDNMQDLKAGYLVGATPWKQQVMQVVGVLAAAFAIAPVLNLLHTAYGIGIERPGGGGEPLAAPQASLMQAVSDGVFNGGLPIGMIVLGMGISVAVIVADLMLEARNSKFRMPVLAVAVGIYLPIALSVPIFIGGLLSWFIHRRQSGDLRETAMRKGLLLAAGLITGEALVGILLAIPIAANNGENPLALTGEETVLMQWPGVILLLIVMAVITRVGRRG